MNEELKKKLIENVIDLEWEMFSSVKASEPSACQEREKTFRLMRWMSHSVLSEGLLEFYLHDLRQAKDLGRNLMTEKYARMEGQIPALKQNPLIARIVEIEIAWKNEVARKYPHTFRGEVARAFGNYMACELETYSDGTLASYYHEVAEARRKKRNLVEERYANLFAKLGYSSIEDREKKARQESVP